jgi:hypothetical protein
MLNNNKIEYLGDSVIAGDQANFYLGKVNNANKN